MHKEQCVFNHKVHGAWLGFVNIKQALCVKNNVFYNVHGAWLKVTRNNRHGGCSVGSQGTKCTIIRCGMSVNILSKKGLDLHIGQCRTD